ncbi:MAG: hypothetical protein EOP09_12375, partial [Proteobacteria bacterium]
NLAQMSGNAAKEISSMLDDSVKKVDQIVSDTKGKVDQLMADAKHTVDRGAQIAEECGEVLKDIVQNAGTVSQMVTGIADASHEQSRGVNEISKAIHELNQSTQMNASAANQCAGSAEQLSAQAFALKQAAESLRVIVSGGVIHSAGDKSVNAAPSKPKSSAAGAVFKKIAQVTPLKKPASESKSSERLPDPSEFDEVG